MSGRTASEAMLLLLVSALVLPSAIQRVEARFSTLFIRADGSVEPATQSIRRIGDQYLLTGDIQTKLDNDGIIVEKDNIILEGGGHSIYGMTLLSYSIGIHVSGRINVTLRNIRVESFHYGIRIVNSSSSSIFGCSLADNWNQIELQASSRNSVHQNNVTSGDKGILLYDSSSNTIMGNNIKNNNFGFLLVRSFNCVISENSIAENMQNAICLSASSGNTVEGNTVEANRGEGILLDSSSNNRVRENTIIKNQKTGIVLWDASDSVTITGNNITSNKECGLSISGTAGLHGSRNCTVTGNNIVANGEYGIKMVDSSNNKLSKNNLVRNLFGFGLNSSSNNLFCQNNIINNTNQVSNLLSRNAWDNGLAGNYWSQHDGEDLDKNGIADQPYYINNEIVDNYPLVYPFMPGDVNRDGKRNIVDINIVAVSYGAVFDGNDGGSVADLDESGRVDILDLAIAAAVFGKEWECP